MEHSIRQRLIVLVVVGAAASFAAPALAERPDDRAGMLGVGAIADQGAQTASPDWFERAATVAIEQQTAVRPDDRAGARGPGAIGSEPVSSPTTSGSDGFEWMAAGLGAGFVVALGVLGALLVASMRRFERHPA